MKFILLSCFFSLMANAAEKSCESMDPFQTVKKYKFTVNIEIESSYSDTAATLLAEINKVTPLKVGNYDMVSFESAEGVQNFRPLENSAGKDRGIAKVDKYKTRELSFTIDRDNKLKNKVLKAIYMAHPYEEPVVHISEVLETRALPEFKKGGRCDSSPHKWYKRK